MKLTLIILLLTGVAATTHNLRGEPDEMMALGETYGQAIRQLKKEKEECPTACGPGFKCKKGTCEPEKQKGGGGQNSAPAASTGECPCSGDKQCKKNKCVCNDRHATGDDCHCRDGYEEVNGKCERKIVAASTGECEIDTDCPVGQHCNSKKECKCTTRGAIGDDCHCRDGYEEVNDKCERKIVGECDNNDDCEDKERCNKKNKCECKKGYRRNRKDQCKRLSRRERCQKNDDCDHKEKCVHIFRNSRRKRCVNKSWKRKYYRCYDKDDCHNHGSCRRSFRYGYRTCHCDKHYAGRSCNRCGWRWGGYKCRRRKYYKKKYYHSSYECDTKLKLVAVVVNDENELDECIENLRFDPGLNDFLEEDFEPERLGDLEVLEVDPCTVDKLKAGLNDLVEEQDITDPTVRVVFVVLNEDTFTNGSCDEDKLDNIQYKLEEMLTCNEIRRLQDFLTIEVDDDSTQCKANELKDAVLQEDYYWREE